MPLTPQEQQELEALESEFGGLNPAEANELSLLGSDLESDGFLQRSGRDLQAREDIAGSLYQQRRAGEISYPEYVFNMAGKVGAGSLGDVGGQVIKSGIETIKDVDQFLGGYGGMATQAAGDAIYNLPLMDTDETLGSYTAKSLDKMGESYAEFKRNNPRAAMNLESATNLALIGVPFAKYGDDVLEGTYKAAKSLGKRQVSRLSAEDLRAMGGSLFEKAERAGGGVTSDFWDDYVNAVAKTTSRKTRLGRDLEAVGGQKDLIDEAISVMKDAKGSPQSLTAIKEADSALGQLAFSPKGVDALGKHTTQGRAILQMQRTLREKLEDAPDNYLIKGIEGQSTRETIDTIKQARKLWAAQTRMEDVQRILEKSVGAPQPSTIIKNGFRRLRDDKKAFKRFTLDEQFAIERAARTGTLEGFTKLSGSGLMPLMMAGAGYATGGPMGGLSAGAGSYLMRETAKNTAEGIARGKGVKVMDVISSGINNGVSPYAGQYIGQAGRSALKSSAPISSVFAPQKETLAEKAKRLYGSN